MPIDYSKFDKIDDSDEEPASVSTGLPSRAPARPKQAWSQEPDSGARRGGRQQLEPAGLDEKLRILGGPTPQDLDQLAGEMQKLGLAKTSPSMSPGAGTPKETSSSNSNPSEPKKLCVRADGRKKVHTTFTDGAEMVEEFDEKTEVLLMRKVRRQTPLGGEGEWTFEVGQATEKAFDPYSDLMRASSSNPVFMRKDTPEHFQWRIRNLPYSADVFSVTIDHEQQQIVVRTTNKKYFKRIDVPDLRRLGQKLKDELLVWKHQHNTLIISYTKPAEVVKEEQKSVQLAETSALQF